VVVIFILGGAAALPDIPGVLQPVSDAAAVNNAAAMMLCFVPSVRFTVVSVTDE
jgi:hypothetical protein